MIEDGIYMYAASNESASPCINVRPMLYSSGHGCHLTWPFNFMCLPTLNHAIIRLPRIPVVNKTHFSNSFAYSPWQPNLGLPSGSLLRRSAIAKTGRLLLTLWKQFRSLSLYFAILLSRFLMVNLSLKQLFNNPFF